MQRQFEILELRVDQMIKQVNALLLERAALRAQVAEQEWICRKQEETRRKVNQRVSKVLAMLDSVSGGNENGA